MPLYSTDPIGSFMNTIECKVSAMLAGTITNIFLCSIRADFREGDEESNFSVFRVRRFSEWPEPLH